MFDLGEQQERQERQERQATAPGELVAAGRSHALDAANIRAVTRALTLALEAPRGISGASSGELVESIRALEELGCVLTAAQAALSVELDSAVRTEQTALGEPSVRVGRGVASLIGFARRTSPHRGARQLGLAKIVATELPHTWQAWRSGRIDEWKATILARETACLGLPERHEVDRLVAGDGDALERMSARQLGARAASEAARLDVIAVTTRRRRAESERFVSLRPAPDAMAWLSALVPMKDGVAAYAGLVSTADCAQAAGDSRSRGQIMADTLTGAILGQAEQARSKLTTWAAAVPDESAKRPAAGINIELVVSDEVLFGGVDRPAWVPGYGPIDGESARELVGRGLSAGERVQLRRLYASPEDGQLVAMDSRGRLFPKALARFIVLRDQTCRTPWCDAPIRHIDHAQAAFDGGPTASANGQGLCEFCNHAKQAPGWRAGPEPCSPPGTITTRLPTGQTYTTGPPPLIGAAFVSARQRPARAEPVAS